MFEACSGHVWDVCDVHLLFQIATLKFSIFAVTAATGSGLPPKAEATACGNGDRKNCVLLLPIEFAEPSI